MKAFEVVPWSKEWITDEEIDPTFPSMVGSIAAFDKVSVLTWTYVYVHRGEIEVDVPYGERVLTHELHPGMYAVVPPDTWVSGVHRDTQAMLVTRHDNRAMFQLGGPCEDKGRMRYIDGCTDSLLLPPVMKGDPCLNLLHFPKGIDQTMHTHPSVRVGIVASGRGLCRVQQDANDDLSLEKIDLEPGLLFVIRPGGIHAFSTPYGQEMRVIAWHPDTDVGPSHEDHPMLNRTIIDGVSAREPERAQYRTQEVRESGKGT